jgi:Clp amino terminal domain, pathogenicity island component
MFELFTDRARRVVVLAQEEARMLAHDYIGTEHILLGLVHEGDGAAAKVLEGLGIELEAVRREVEEIIGRGKRAPSGHIAFTPRAKKILELSLRESKQLGHGYIGTEHILLGLVREGDGVAAQVLTKMGADLDRVRQQVAQVLQATVLPTTADITVTGQQRARRLLTGGLRSSQLSPRSLSDRAAELEQRLAALESRVGVPPEEDITDPELEQVRRDKESAIDAQDFEAAAGLREREEELLRAQLDRQAAAAAHRHSLTEQVGGLAAEIERLKGLLREHGIQPDDGAA